MFRFGSHLEHYLGIIESTKFIQTVLNEPCKCSTLQISPVLLLDILFMGKTKGCTRFF